MSRDEPLTTEELGDSKPTSLKAVKLAVDSRHCFFGKSGSGKTTALLTLAESLTYDLTVFDVVGNLAELKDLHRGGRKVEYYLIDPHDEDKLAEALTKCLKQGRQMAIFDEADRFPYYPTSPTPLSNFVNLGRNYLVGYMATARRTANMPKDWIANARYAWVFRTIQKDDVSSLVAEYDVTKEELRNLPDHEFLFIDNGEPLFQGKFPEGRTLG